MTPHVLADSAPTTSHSRPVGQWYSPRSGEPELPSLPGWTAERRIADGRHAEVLLVRRATDSHGPFCAAKLLHPTGAGAHPPTDARRRLMREVAALRAAERAGCTGVPRVLAHGVGAGEGDRPWLVMPYYPGAMRRSDPCGGTWSEPYAGDVGRVLSIVATLADTLATLHGAERAIVHGDVSVDSVLFGTDGTAPILGGFSRARVGRAASSCSSDPCAHTREERSARWTPPECAERQCRATSPAGDVFMLGGLLYEALSGGGVLPPAAQWGALCVHEARQYALPRLLADRTDDPRVVAVSTLLRGMLTLDPARRMSARGVAYACRGIRSTSPRRLTASRAAGYGVVDAPATTGRSSGDAAVAVSGG